MSSAQYFLYYAIVSERTGYALSIDCTPKPSGTHLLVPIVNDRGSNRSPWFIVIAHVPITIVKVPVVTYEVLIV